MLGTLENQQVGHGDPETIHHAFVDKDVFILKKPPNFNQDSFKEKLEGLRRTNPGHNLNRGKVFIFYNENNANDIELYTYKEDRANKSGSNSIPNVEFKKINISNDDDKKIYTICLQAKVFLDKPEGIVQWPQNHRKESFYPRFITYYDDESIGLNTDLKIKYPDGDQEGYYTVFPKKIPAKNHQNTPSTPIFNDFNKSKIADISDILTGSLSIQSVRIFYDDKIIETQRDNNKSQEALLNDFFNDRLSIFNKNTEEERRKAEEEERRREAEERKRKAEEEERRRKEEERRKAEEEERRREAEEERRRKLEESKKTKPNPSISGYSNKDLAPSSRPASPSIVISDLNSLYTKLRSDQLSEYLTELNGNADNFSKYDHFMPQSFKVAPKSQYAGFGLKIECDYSSNTLCVIEQNNSKNYVSRLDSEWPSCGEKFEGNIELFFTKIEDFYKVSRKNKEAMDCAITCFFRNRALNDDKMTLSFEDGKTQILRSKTCQIKDENGKKVIDAKSFSDDDKNRIEGSDKINIEEIRKTLDKTSHRSHGSSL